MVLDDDFDYDMRPVEQDEEFFHEEFNDMLANIPERERVACYYKLIKRLPDIEYEAKCAECDGFPVRDGCVRYTTHDHIKNFVERMRAPPSQ